MVLGGMEIAPERVFRSSFEQWARNGYLRAQIGVDACRNFQNGSTVEGAQASPGTAALTTPQNRATVPAACVFLLCNGGAA
jgi:hypothetical protein